MNFLMAGMVPTAALGRALLAAPLSPLAPDFWFVMSMALLVGFVVAYPMNWWLVAQGLKHGMMTVRPPSAETGDGTASRQMSHAAAPPISPHHHEAGHAPPPSVAEIARMAGVSIGVFALATWLSLWIIAS
jgi:Domain of unknown function (DUF4396)